MPVRRYLNNAARLYATHWHHPGIRGLGHISLDPGLRVIGCKIGLDIMMHERVVVNNTSILELRNEFFRRRPRRCCVTLWLLAIAKFSQDINTSIQDFLLLGCRQFRDVFVRVAMESDLVARVPDFGELFWK